MQDCFIKLQKDVTTNVVTPFKQNVNGVTVDKTTGQRTPIGNTMFVFKTEEDDTPLNFVTGKQYVAKTRQAVHRLEHLDTNKALKWIKKRVKTESLVELELLGLSDIWTNPETLAKAFNMDLEIMVDIHIVKQEFAINLVRYKAGKHAECLNSYKQSLARHANSDIFQARFTNHLLQGIISVDKKLVDDKSVLRDANGTFSFNLVETLDADVQAKIASALDTIMFGKKTDKLTINGKLKRLPNFGAHLVEENTSAFIVSYNFPVDTDDAIVSYPDKVIAIDKDNKALKAFQQAERQTKSASNFDMLAEQTVAEETVEETADAVLDGTEE